MARTGISIKVSNTVLGAPPKVNANSILFVNGASAVDTGSMSFALDTVYVLQSVDDLTALGITELNNKDVYTQVSDFYAPTPNINNSGTLLWLVGFDEYPNQYDFKPAILQTVTDGFQYRPRNILISDVLIPFATAPTYPVTLAAIQANLTALYDEGFATCAIYGSPMFAPLDVSKMVDLSMSQAPMVGMLVVSKRQADRASVGAVGGYMAQLSVGTSIGDTTFPYFATDMYFTDGTGTTENAIEWKNTPCASLTLNDCDTLGEKQYIFARTRPPRNGLWFNDGATAEEATTALSTLENARTIAAMVDDLRTFFTPYINSKVPVTSTGDINPTYKQVVLDNAREFVVIPYIENGDISDARISLKAQYNDMTGTKTWEVTLEILDAPTLRWINGYVFYVKSLS
jgi:hypothetical protein